MKTIAIHTLGILLATTPIFAATRATDSSAWSNEVRAWRTKLDANDPGMKSKWFQPDVEDSDWKTTKLPSALEHALPGHDGTVWYRRTLTLSKKDADLPHTLNLGTIDDMDMAWVNGVQVGGVEIPGYWLKPRSYAVPAKLLKTGRNIIVVRVIDHGWGGGFTGRPNQMSLTRKGSRIPLNGDWHYRAGASLKSLGMKNLSNPPKVWPHTEKPTQPSLVEVPAALRPLAKPAFVPPAFRAGFKIDHDVTIAVFGDSNAAECQRNGWLEMRLLSAHPKHRITVRNLSFRGDTLFHQPRPRNFFGQSKPSYGEQDGRELMTAHIAVLWFGQMESLAGPKGLPEFETAYEKLIKNVSEYTRRIVLVSPPPFEDPLKIGFKLKHRNRNLNLYAAAIRKIATAHKLPLVDLTTALKNKSVTTDGSLLSDTGHKIASQEFAEQLGFNSALPEFANYVRETIREKNAIWNRYWLPSNWAFLYGNRQTQPSSRDHQDRSVRWFPMELEVFRKKTEVMEKEIRDRIRSQ